MITYNRWLRVLFGGGLMLMGLALVVSLLTPFIFGIAGPWVGSATGMPGGMMGPGMMSEMMGNSMTGMPGGMMGPGMMGSGGFNGPFGAPFGFGALSWLMALPSLLFSLGLLMLVGAGGVWLAQSLGLATQAEDTHALSK